MVNGADGNYNMSNVADGKCHGWQTSGTPNFADGKGYRWQMFCIFETDAPNSKAKVGN